MKFVLDIGCEKTPGMIHGIRSMTYIGIDSDTSIKPPFQDNGVFLYADARYLPFRNEIFNTIFALQVLEHIHDYASAINELYRCSKKMQL